MVLPLWTVSWFHYSELHSRPPFCSPFPIPPPFSSCKWMFGLYGVCGRRYQSWAPWPNSGEGRGGGVTGGLSGASNPTLWGSGQHPIKFWFLDPILGWADLPMVLCMIFAHVFRCDGFRSMVLDALACINIYSNIERNIMKDQSGSPNFGIQGKIFMYLFWVSFHTENPQDPKPYFFLKMPFHQTWPLSRVFHPLNLMPPWHFLDHHQ